MSLRSRSAWKRLGVVITEDAVPAGVVLGVKNREEKHSHVMPWQLVIRTEGKYFIVATQYYDVFPKPEAESETDSNEKEGKKVEHSSSTPIIPSISLVQEVNTKTRRKSNKIPVDASKRVSAKHVGGRPLVNSVKAYVPEALSEDKKDALGEDRDMAFYLMGMVHLYRVKQKREKDDWVEISSKYVEEAIGWDNWTRVRDKLIRLGLLEQTKREVRTDGFEFGIVDIENRGVKGGKCYGYRLSEGLRNSTVRLTTLTDKKIIKLILGRRKRKTPLERWLERGLGRITVEDVPDAVLFEIAQRDKDKGTVKGKVDSYKQTLQMIRDGVWNLEPDGFSGRYHSTLTGLKRELRPYLRVDGKPLKEIDIKNCQPLMIAIYAAAHGCLDEHFLTQCQGDLYQYIADKLGVTRDKVKRQLTQRALFASNGSKHQRTKVMTFFRKEFPAIWRFITKMKDGERTKDNDKPHNKLAKIAQKQEVGFVFRKVCKRIMAEVPDCFVATIHDCVMILPESSEYVKNVIEDEFRKIGVNPKVDIK